MPKFYKTIEGWSDFLPIYDAMLNELPDNSIFVELGVWKGKSAVYLAELIMEQKRNIIFYAFDNFLGSPEHSKRDVITSNTLEDVCRNNIRAAGVAEHIILKKCDSAEASKFFEDDTVGFVFIDACHEYEAVVKDIAAWWPKVKSKMFIGGHDYNDAWPGVKRAVDEFASKHRLNVTVNGATWLIAKP